MPSSTPIRTLGGAGARDRFELCRETACKRVRTLGDGRRFDAVLVDEEQDLGKSGLDLAWEMLKRGRRMLKPGRQDPGTFIMAMDPDQDIFLQRRREMDWNPPGMTARGRTTIFRRNYRNTREVVGLAWELLFGAVAPAPGHGRARGGPGGYAPGNHGMRGPHGRSAGGQRIG